MNNSKHNASMALGLMRQADIALSKILQVERSDLDVGNAKLLLAEAIEVMEKRSAKVDP